MVIPKRCVLETLYPMG